MEAFSRSKTLAFPFIFFYIRIPMTLMLRQTLIALSLFLVACGGSTSNIKRYTARGTIDSQKISNKSKSADDSDFENPDTVLHDYYRTCKDTFKIDTTIYSNKKPVHIQFQHYSTNDSAIHLPDYYVSTYGLKNFVTHDFESHLRVTSNDSVLADATIDKNTFVQYAH